MWRFLYSYVANGLLIFVFVLEGTGLEDHRVVGRASEHSPSETTAPKSQEVRPFGTPELRSGGTMDDRRVW